MRKKKKSVELQESLEKIKANTKSCEVVQISAQKIRAEEIPESPAAVSTMSQNNASQSECFGLSVNSFYPEDRMNQIVESGDDICISIGGGGDVAGDSGEDRDGVSKIELSEKFDRMRQKGMLVKQLASHTTPQDNANKRQRKVLQSKVTEDLAGSILESVKESPALRTGNLVILTPPAIPESPLSGALSHTPDTAFDPVSTSIQSRGLSVPELKIGAAGADYYQPLLSGTDQSQVHARSENTAVGLFGETQRSVLFGSSESGESFGSNKKTSSPQIGFSFGSSTSVETRLSGARSEGTQPPLGFSFGSTSSGCIMGSTGTGSNVFKSPQQPSVSPTSFCLSGSAQRTSITTEGPVQQFEYVLQSGKSGGLFGSSQQSNIVSECPRPQSGSRFGSGTSGGLSGSTKQTDATLDGIVPSHAFNIGSSKCGFGSTQGTGSSVFGSPQQPTTLFGSSIGGEPFLSTQQASTAREVPVQQSGYAFGSGTCTSGSLFGSTQASGSSLFASLPVGSSGSSNFGGLFGSNQGTGSSVFGTPQQPITSFGSSISGGSFGSTQQTCIEVDDEVLLSGDGLRSGTSEILLGSTQGTGSSLFGSTQQPASYCISQTTKSGGLFGSTQQTSAILGQSLPQSGYALGSGTFMPGGLFGSAKETDATSSGTIPPHGLSFGSNKSGGLFGSAQGSGVMFGSPHRPVGSSGSSESGVQFGSTQQTSLASVPHSGFSFTSGGGFGSNQTGDLSGSNQGITSSIFGSTHKPPGLPGTSKHGDLFGSTQGSGSSPFLQPTGSHRSSKFVDFHGSSQGTSSSIIIGTLGVSGSSGLGKSASDSSGGQLFHLGRTPSSKQTIPSSFSDKPEEVAERDLTYEEERLEYLSKNASLGPANAEMTLQHMSEIRRAPVEAMEAQESGERLGSGEEVGQVRNPCRSSLCE